MTWTAHFYDVAHVFESTLDAEARVRRVLELTSRLMPCDRITLFDLGETLSSALLFVPDITEAERPALARRITELADLLRDDAVLERRVVEVPMSGDKTAHLAVPLVARNRMMGVILVESATGGYEPAHLGLLSVVAGQVAAYLTLLRCERKFARRSAESTSAIAEFERAVALRDGLLAKLVRVLRGPPDAAGLARIADQLDDLGRIRAGEDLAVERKPVDLERICRDVIGALETSSVSVSTLGNTWCVGDSGRLGQVVTELVENALAHGKSGALTITIDGEESEVVLRSHHDGVIAEERVAAIFEPFTDDPQPRPAGLGLGLYIAHRIVMNHGGTMELVSSEEEGTTFVVRLPRGLFRH